MQFEQFVINLNRFFNEITKDYIFKRFKMLHCERQSTGKCKNLHSIRSLIRNYFTDLNCDEVETWKEQMTGNISWNVLDEINELEIGRAKVEELEKWKASCLRKTVDSKGWDLEVNNWKFIAGKLKLKSSETRLKKDLLQKFLTKARFSMHGFISLD